MVESSRSDDIAIQNSRSLRTLARAITLSQGQFSLVLARCNYAALQESLVPQLRELCPLEIRELSLHSSARTLYSTIQDSLDQDPPKSLMVSGLESVTALDDLLASSNQVRDEFRKRLPFPLILWVNDTVLHKFVKLAPDFASWAATPVKFELETEALISFLQQICDRIFSAFLDVGQGLFLNNSAIIGCRYQLELDSALKDLFQRGVQLAPELAASLEFIWGREDYAADHLDAAIAHFQNSLTFWQQQIFPVSSTETSPESPKSRSFFLAETIPQLTGKSSRPAYLEQQAILLFHIGLSYHRQAELQPAENHRYWQEARHYFQESIAGFEAAGREDLLAQFILPLGEVLQRLEAWEPLQELADKSLRLHQTYGSEFQLAQDYGFLAKMALHQSRWQDACDLVEQGLSILARVITQNENVGNQKLPQSSYPLLWQQIFQLSWVKALRNLNAVHQARDRLEQAVAELKTVIEKSDHRYDPRRYGRLLEVLRSLYFEAGRYREAFLIKQKQRSVEQQYGYRAFIGAGQLQPKQHAISPSLGLNSVAPSTLDYQENIPQEIAASGRQQDVNRLLERISRPDYKLTVIHGPSGVGKSSLVNAGLVPALKNTSIGDQIALPIVVRVYRDWVKVLARSFAQSLQTLQETEVQATPATVPMADSIDLILHQLRENEEHNLLTILIFDQFEEFFFVLLDGNQRRQFYQFLDACLKIPYLKIIFSIRQDYLHYLLELEKAVDLDEINSNLLDKRNRYPLENFSPADARAVIQSLTEEAKFYLEPALIQELVRDLAGELGEVRPIELQIVGAQLQAENINTLAKYQQNGPKEKLVGRFLEEAIADCGPENAGAARLVLFFLTDENGTRPLKTRAEIASDLADLESIEKLELILEILVRSGLVVLLPEVPTDRYQLVHDYLVNFIRYLQQQEAGLQAQLEDLRKQEAESQVEIERLRTELAQKAQQAEAEKIDRKQGMNLITELRELRNREEFSRVEIERLRAEVKQKALLAELADTKEKQMQSEARLNRVLKGALTGAIAAIGALTFSTAIAVSQRRDAVISEIEAHTQSSEAFFALNKDIDALIESLIAGKQLQTAVWAKPDIQRQVETALQQSVYGIQERNRLEGHTAGVLSLTYSPQGDLIASASADKMIALWEPNGKLMTMLRGHSDRVSSISFSPDGELIASGSWDKTIKLWQRDGTLLKTFSGHNANVLWVTFSPDGKKIASASADKTIKIWQLDTETAITLSGHTQPVTSINFSPQGDRIVSASADNTIKLWSADGKLVKTIQGHRDQVTSVTFSPNNQLIASGSLDNTIKLWNPDGTLLKTLEGHDDSVYYVAFSPDSQFLASASRDKSVKLWKTSDGMLQKSFEGHTDWVSSLSFSPDQQTLASGSRDKTIKLWSLENQLLNTLKGHTGAVNWVSFSPNGTMIATASIDNTVKLWQPDGTLLKTLTGHNASVWGVSFSPTEDLIASGSRDNTVKLWRKDGTLVKTLTGHTAGVLGVSFSPDGELIASASRDNTVKLWRKDGTLVTTLTGHEAAVNLVTFSPDGNAIASASEDRTIKLWSREGTLLHTLNDHNEGVWGVTFSPDGSAIASASLDSTVKLWRRDGTLVQTLRGHSDGVTSVSFSPDGQQIASASRDNTVNLWSPDGTLLHRLRGNIEGVTSVSFSPDSQMLALASADNRVILWNLEELNLSKLLIHSCEWLQDYLQTNVTLEERDRALCDSDRV